MFHQIFLSPQVKRWAIIPSIHVIEEFPHELPNNLRLTIFEKWEISGKYSNSIE